MNNLAAYKSKRASKTWLKLWRSRYLLLLFAPIAVYYIIFHYAPMYGVLIAFKDYRAVDGIWNSKWVGLQHFRDFFASPYAWRIIRNTLSINLYSLVAGFPVPLILAIMINEVRNSKLRRTVQTIVYLPHFISIVVVSGMLRSFLSPSTGMINQLIAALGGEPIHFLARAEWFQTVFVLSGIWQGAGWGSIIYLAALAGVDQELYEAAIVDGANRWQRIRYISFPSILPTAIIMLILRMGSMFTVGFEKVMLLYTPSTYETGDVISTYIYRSGIQNAEFSYTTAIGLFNSLANFAFIIIFNRISRKVSETSLW